MKKDTKLNPNSIKLKGQLSVMDKFKLKSIRSAKELKIGDIVHGFFFGAGIITDMILSKTSYSFNEESYDAWIIVDSIDGKWKNKSESLSDKNICNGGYNPWLLFKKEEDSIAYNKWCNQPIGKGVISHMEDDWDYDGRSEIPVFKQFSLKCEKRTVKELESFGFRHKDVRDYMFPNY